MPESAFITLCVTSADFLRTSLTVRRVPALRRMPRERAADQFDHALAGQGLQVFFSGVGRAKTQFGGDLGPRGRCPRLGDGSLDEFENLLLPWREFGFIVHVVALAMSVILYRAVGLSSTFLTDPFRQVVLHGN